MENSDQTDQQHDVSTINDRTSRSVRLENQHFKHLPKFRGNRIGNEQFQQGIDVRSFFRTLENYFFNNRVTCDEDKKHILYATIDKDQGDAFTMVETYMKDELTYEEMEAAFKEAYVSVADRGMPEAIKDLLATINGSYPNFKMELCHVRNNLGTLLETNLNRECIKEQGISKTSLISTTNGKPPVQLMDFLLNMGMVMYSAWRTQPRVFDEAKQINSEKQPAELISMLIRTSDEHALRESRKKNTPKRKTEEVVYKIRENEQCGKCGRTNHATKDCKANVQCTFCKYKGHTAKECRKRKRQELFCEECGINGHNEETCWKRNKKGNKKDTERKTKNKKEWKNKGNKGNKVRQITELEDPDESDEEDSDEEESQ